MTRSDEKKSLNKFPQYIVLYLEIFDKDLLL